MITKCIVSVFAHARKTAVLFDSSLRSNLAKSLVLAGGLLAPAVANAELVYKVWWGASDVKISQLNDCGSVYEISYTSENDGQLQLDKDGVNVGSKNTVFASDMSKFTWQSGGSNAIKYTGGSTDDLVIYLISGSEKDTLTSVKPTYGTLMVKGDNYKNMSLATSPVFNAVYCEGSSSTLPTGATFQWQKYNEKTETWDDIEDATESEYVAPAKSLLDETKVRVMMTSGGKQMASAYVTVTYALPSVSVNLRGADLFVTEQRPTYEYELDYGNPFAVEFIAKGGAVFDSYELYSRSNNSAKFTTLVATVSGDKASYSFTPEENLEYLVVATGKDVRPGHEETEISVKDTFFVRVRYSWDEGAELDTLFFDDFGRFNDANSYTTYDGKEFTDYLTDQEGNSDTIVNYWAPDYFNSVKNHEFAIHDPKVGPREECNDGDYNKYYACWGDKGKCDGYRVEDGYYAILPNPDYSNCGQNVKDYWSGYDHTTEESGVLGGMLFVNCSGDSRDKVLIEREIQIANECENARLLFSAYVNNATAISSNKPVNVRLIVRDADDKVIAEVPSGDIYPRSMKGGQWANLSFMFSATKGGKYTLQVVNNQVGGEVAGNDLLFDDVLILAAYPTVNVYRDRDKSSMVPIDTCEPGKYPLFVLNQHDIKKYINEPKYLYQYSKDSVNWINIGTITELDSFVVTLSKEDPLSWDTTYYRGIVASNEDVITNILAGNPPTLSCDSVYAISDPFRVVFDFGGPLDADVKTSLCVGDTFKITVSAHKRPKYRWVDSKTKETINNMDTTFSYVVSAEDPADSVFYFVAEQRLGCTDTMKVTVHRKLYVDFTTPDPFITCLYDTPAEITDIFPADGVKFDWSSGEYEKKETGKSLIIPDNLPQQGTFVVTGNAEDYCTTTKSFKYDIHNPIKATLTADDRNDSLFCNGADVKLNLTANVSIGTPVTYYWLNDGEQVAFTTHPVNKYSFGGLTEGNHVFSVKIVDEVCNKVENSSEFETVLPISVREPINLTLTADTAVCEGAAFNAEVACEHLLDADATILTWNVTTDNGVLANATTKTTASASTNAITPDPKTTSTEKLTLKVSVDDKVCPNNEHASSTFDVNVYKKLDVVVTTDRNDNLFCMKDGVGITFTADTKKGVVYRYDWIADGVLAKSTGLGENSYTFPVETEGTHVYGVTMSDGVCNLAGESEFKFSVPVKTREAIELTLTTDTAICETEKLNASVECKHLLDAAGSTITWVVETSNGQLATAQTLTDADQKATNSVVPKSTTSTTEALMLTASTVDEVCVNEDKTPRTVLDTKKTNVYKTLDVAVAYDRDDNLFCMEGNSQITFKATTKKGVVNKYEWIEDGQVIATTDNGQNTYSFLVLTEGTHVFGLKMYDGVCSADGAPYQFSQSVETRKPVTIALEPAAVNFCEDGTLNVDAKLEHLLADPVNVEWKVSNNGKLAAATTSSSAGVASNTLSANAETITNKKENVVLSAKVYDNVCKREVVSEDATVELHKLVNISITVDGVNGSKCLAAPGDELVNLVVNVDRGDPAYYIWSNNDRTEAPSTQYTLTLGSNFITVLAFDLVCKKDGAAATALTSVETRNPLNVSVAQTAGVSPTCVGEQIEMTSTVSNNFDGDQVIYSWSPVSATDAVITDKPGVGHTDYVSTVVASNGICPAQSASAGVDVQDSVYIKIDVADNLCQEQDNSVPLTLSVNVISGNPQSFVWSTGEETVDPQLVVYPNKSQQFWVYAVDAVCANSFKSVSKTVEVSNNFTLEISVKYTDVQMDTEVQLNSKIVEDSVFSAPSTVTWFKNDKETGTGNLGDWKKNMPKQGTYVFHAEADGGHCGTIVSNYIEIDVADYHQIPTAFTPYNDNKKNNIFMKGYYVEIFNRYQQSVYEGDNGWDGYYNGSLAEPGTYFYRLRKKDGRMIKGTIELVKF